MEIRLNRLIRFISRDHTFILVCGIFSSGKRGPATFRNPIPIPFSTRITNSKIAMTCQSFTLRRKTRAFPGQKEKGVVVHNVCNEYTYDPVDHPAENLGSRAHAPHSPQREILVNSRETPAPASHKSSGHPRSSVAPATPRESMGSGNRYNPKNRLDSCPGEKGPGHEDTGNDGPGNHGSKGRSRDDAVILLFLESHADLLVTNTFLPVSTTCT